MFLLSLKERRRKLLYRKEVIQQFSIIYFVFIVLDLGWVVRFLASEGRDWQSLSTFVSALFYFVFLGGRANGQTKGQAL